MFPPLPLPIYLPGQCVAPESDSTEWWYSLGHAGHDRFLEIVEWWEEICFLTLWRPSDCTMQKEWTPMLFKPMLCRHISRYDLSLVRIMFFKEKARCLSCQGCRPKAAESEPSWLPRNPGLPSSGRLWKKEVNFWSFGTPLLSGSLSNSILILPPDIFSFIPLWNLKSLVWKRGYLPHRESARGLEQSKY